LQHVVFAPIIVLTNITTSFTGRGHL